MCVWSRWRLVVYIGAGEGEIEEAVAGFAEIRRERRRTYSNFDGISGKFRGSIGYEVGDFGLARWQPDGNLAVKTRVIGTFGYLAPEYAQSGQVTEKADVYSFGIVLLELVTGRRAVDINRPKGQQCLAEWARPILKEYAIQDLLDPRLRNIYCNHEVFCMLHAASLCINREPNSRPHISQVLRILEGDIFMEQNYASTPLAMKIKGLGSHKQINNSNGFTATMLSNLG